MYLPVQQQQLLNDWLVFFGGKCLLSTCCINELKQKNFLNCRSNLCSRKILSFYLKHKCIRRCLNRYCAILTLMINAYVFKNNTQYICSITRTHTFLYNTEYIDILYVHVHVLLLIVVYESRLMRSYIYKGTMICLCKIWKQPSLLVLAHRINMPSTRANLRKMFESWCDGEHYIVSTLYR